MNAETATALDPQAKAVLDLIIKAGRPAYHQLSPKDARQLFRETRPASTPVPPEIGMVKDLTAEGPLGPIPLRLYRPKGVPAATALPALVFFHGGGWVIGDLDTHDVLCRQLTAESGASVVMSSWCTSQSGWLRCSARLSSRPRLRLSMTTT